MDECIVNNKFGSGFGKVQTEDIILDESDEMTKYLASCPQPVKMENFFNIPVMNILWQVVGGKKFKYDDDKLVHFVQLIQGLFASGFKLSYLPILRWLAPEWSGYNLQKKLLAEMKKIIQEIIDEHRDTFDRDNPKDFIDIYLKELGDQEEGEPGSSFSLLQLTGICADMFEAGGETVGSTLNWAVLYLAHHPQIQVSFY